MGNRKEKVLRRQRIRYRIRKKAIGTSTVPRLSVYRSNIALYVQLIDDTHGHTLLALDTRKWGRKTAQSAVQLGEALAAKVREKNFARIIFDRSGYRFHGLVKFLFNAVDQNLAETKI